MTQTTKQVLAEQQRQADREQHGEHQTALDWENEGPPEEFAAEQHDEPPLDLTKFASTQRELTTTSAPPPSDDGWAAEANAADRLLRGNLLKFVDRVWSYGRDGRTMRRTQLLALGCGAAWQRWEGKQRVDIRARVPGRPLPTRDELGHLDESQWERGPDGKPRDPWQFYKFVYLVDVQSGELFTFSTRSNGGQSAVSDLADQVIFMRDARPGAVPVVELGDSDMPTRYGLKSRPLFRIVGWRDSGQLTKLAAPSASEALDDENPF